MSPENWARELSAEIVMGISDGLSRKIGFDFADDAKVEFARDMYPALHDLVRRVQNDALANAKAAIGKLGRNPDGGEAAGYMTAIEDATTAVTDLMRAPDPR